MERQTVNEIKLSSVLYFAGQKERKRLKGWVKEEIHRWSHASSVLKLCPNTLVQTGPVRFGSGIHLLLHFIVTLLKHLVFLKPYMRMTLGYKITHPSLYSPHTEVYFSSHYSSTQMHRVARLGPATEQAIITHSNEHVRTADRQALPPTTYTRVPHTSDKKHTWHRCKHQHIHAQTVCIYTHTHIHFMLQCGRDPSTAQQADRLHTVSLF